MYQLKGRRFQLIEVKVPTQIANHPYSFEQQPLLQSITGGQRVFVYAIKVYAFNALTASPITPSNAAPTAADIQGTTLTLSVLGQLRIRNLPLADSNTIWSNDTNYVPFTMSSVLFINLWGIDWTQSYITTVIAAHTTNVSYCFGVWFAYSTDIEADVHEGLPVENE